MAREPCRSTSLMASTAPTAPTEFPMIKYLANEGFLLHQQEGLVGAILHTGRGIPPRAEVAFHCYPPLQVHGNRAVRAGQDAGPAPHALRLVQKHRAVLRLADGAGQTSVSAQRFLAMETLHSKRQGALLLHTHPGHGTGPLLVVGMHQ